jgi:hypothetical protein
MLYRISLTLSYQILAVTVGWHIYEITRDPLSLGLIGLAEVVPYFCSALFAGHAEVLFAQVLARKDFARGSAVGTVIFQVSQVAGPALGGVLIAWSGLVSAYMASGLFALTGVVSLLLLTIREEFAHENNTSVWQGIASGLKFVFAKQLMLAAMALDMFAVLFGGAVSMLPAFPNMSM